MELRNLLENSDWQDAAPAFSREEIHRATKARVNKNIRSLYRSYYVGLVLNLIFLTGFSSIYIFNPSVEFLIPVLIIAACYLFFVTDLIFRLLTNKRVDTSQDLKTVMQDALLLNRKIYERQARYHVILFTTLAAGGFLLGLAVQGWTVEKYLEKPAIFIFLAVFLALIYYLAKKKSFEKISKRLTLTNYRKSIDYLKKQLKLLEEAEPEKETSLNKKP